MNDFDEGYCGPFTWDVKRLLASLNLLAHSKGFSDEEIERVLRTCVTSYVKQVETFCKDPNHTFALTLKNTSGKIKKTLNETRIKSHVAHLDSMTVIEDYDRRFIRSKMIKDVDDELRAQIVEVGNTLRASRIVIVGFILQRLSLTMSKPSLNRRGKVTEASTSSVTTSRISLLDRRPESARPAKCHIRYWSRVRQRRWRMTPFST